MEQRTERARRWLPIGAMIAGLCLTARAFQQEYKGTLKPVMVAGSSGQTEPLARATEAQRAALPGIIAADAVFAGSTFFRKDGGIRLSLVEPANLPDRPFSPNRPLLMAAGAAAGLLLGLLVALGIELVNRPVRSPRQLEQLDIPVIGLVPLIKAAPRPRRRRLRGFLSREKRLAG